MDVYVYSLNRRADTFSHRTQVAKIYGANVEHWQGVMGRLRRKAENIRVLLDAGHDPLAIPVERAHRMGLAFWAGMS